MEFIRGGRGIVRVVRELLEQRILFDINQSLLLSTTFSSILVSSQIEWKLKIHNRWIHQNFIRACGIPETVVKIFKDWRIKGDSLRDALPGEWMWKRKGERQIRYGVGISKKRSPSKGIRLAA